MHTLLQDLRYGARTLVQNLGFTAAAVLCLGLGVGATAAIFSVVNAVVVRPLPYAQPERLVRLYTEWPTWPGGGLHRFWTSAPEYLDLVRETTSWESLDGWSVGGANVGGGNEPVRVTSCAVTGGLLKSLGVAPLLGRALASDDDKAGAPLTAVLSYGLWQRAFGGDRGIVGRSIQFNGRASTVVGVMPAGFQFPPGELDEPEIWAPLQIDPARPGGRGSHFLSLLGRLKPGVPLRQAQDELAQLVRHWGEAANQNTHAFRPGNHEISSYPLHGEVVGAVKPAMMMLMGAVGFVLLIACVNVANLLLARAEARQREIAVRKALGADLPRLIRQFVTEGVLLSLLGAALGLALAFGGLRLILAASQGSIPRAGEITIDRAVLGFALIVSFATGLFFGLAPLAQVMASSVSEALKAAAGRTTATAGAQHFRRILVVGELGLALVLLIGSGLMVRAFWNLQQVDSGVVPHNILSMRVALPQAVYRDNAALIRFWDDALARLSRLPGVESATMSTGLPPVRPINANDTQIEGYNRKPGGPLENIDYWNVVGPKYFETTRIRLIEGRFFDDRDGENTPAVAVINQTMAHMYWPGQSAIGRRIRPGSQDPWRTIVGIVADVKNAGLDKPTGTELYMPYRQLAGVGFGLRASYLLLKTTGDPMALVRPARTEVRSMDAALPVAQVRSMEDVMLAAQSRPRFLTLLLGMFSSVALALAALGIYGVISYSVARRTNEMGIRMAMGAQPGDILKLILGQGARLGVVGVLIGAAGAVALTRLMRGLLFGVSALDPATFVLMALVLVAVTLLACYVPARRAMKVDPMVALRYE